MRQRWTLAAAERVKNASDMMVGNKSDVIGGRKLGEEGDEKI